MECAQACCFYLELAGAVESMIDQLRLQAGHLATAKENKEAVMGEWLRALSQCELQLASSAMVNLFIRVLIFQEGESCVKEGKPW